MFIEGSLLADYLLIGVLVFTMIFLARARVGMLILVLHFLIHMPLVASSATLKIFKVASNIGVFVIFFMAGKMAFLIGLPIVLASITGNYIGGHMTIKSGDKIIKPLILTSIAILFTSLWY